MTVRAGFSGTYKFARISLFCLLISGILLIVCYAAPYWTTSYRGHDGLWISCDGKDCYERWNQWVEGWIRATQFMMSLALVCWTFSVTALFVYTFHKDYFEDKRLVFTSAVCIFLAGVLTTLSIITWAAGQTYKSSEMLNWPYIICCFISAGFFFIFYFLYRELKYQPDYAILAT